MALDVKLYTTPSCSWCVKAKDFLKSKKIKYQEFDVAEDENARAEMVEKSGQLGVPVIIVSKDGQEKVIIGFDQEELTSALA